MSNSVPLKSYVAFNNNLKISKVKISNNLDLTITTMREEFDTINKTTILYTNYFSDSIVARYFSDEALSAKCLVYRKTPDQTYYSYIGYLSDGTFTMKDYDIGNKKSYHYLISIDEGLSNAGDKIIYGIYEVMDESEEPYYSQACWDNWLIYDIEPIVTDDEFANDYTVSGYAWSFKYNMQADSITQNLSFSPADTLGRFAKIYSGEKNYLTGSNSCLLGDITEIDGAYVYTETDYSDTSYTRHVDTEKLDAWLDFCQNGKLKLLRDRKGNRWVVQIVGSTYSYIQANGGRYTSTYGQIESDEMVEVSFQWQEVEDASKVNIYTKKE